MKKTLLIILGIALFSLSSLVFLQAQRQSLNSLSSNSQVEQLSDLKSALALQNVLRTISKTITPGVVSIDVEGTQAVPNQFNDPFFQFFFGNNERLQRRYSSAGSGFIISPDGYLFSNWHVVQNADAIKITLADGREFEARLIGADTELDIALLKIDGKDLPVVPIGDSQNVETGDLVVAIGNPFGLAGSFTFGAVSGIGRDGFFPGLQRFIQTDAAVNPGNSGGPLINIRGQAIGINTAIRSQSGGYEGISFAIPINVAKNIAEQLLSKGVVERGFLGIVPQDLDSVTRRSLKLDPKEGVVVSSLDDRGPADRHGIEQGDIILKVNGQSISTPSQLTESIASFPPNTSVEIEILRNGKKHTIAVTLGTRPSSIVRVDQNEDAPKLASDIELRGITFTTASGSDLKRNGAKTGILVKKVNPNSPLAFILSSGDVIATINNYNTDSISSLKNILPNLENQRALTFSIYKQGYLVYRSIEF